MVVGPRGELDRGSVRIGDLNWLDDVPAPGEHVAVQMRHRAPAAAAVVRARGEGIIELELETPQRAVTPGQSGVIFRGDQVVGGGRIR